MMKKSIYIFALLMMLTLGACSNNDEPIYANSGMGSNRDWTYYPEQISVYIDGILQTQVQEITPLSYQMTAKDKEANYPYYYNTVFKIKGLVKKNKVTEITTKANIDDFEGFAIIKGIEYKVSGHFTGNPFHLPEEMGVEIHIDQTLSTHP